METPNLFFNTRNYIFKSKLNGWILYSGQSGNFFKISEREKEIVAKSENVEEIPEVLKTKLFNIDAITFKTSDEYKNIHNYRYLKFQSNHIFSLTFCPVTKVGENKITIDRKIIPSLVDFCVKKNQNIIKCLWLGEKPLSSLAFIKEFSKN